MYRLFFRICQVNVHESFTRTSLEFVQLAKAVIEENKCLVFEFLLERFKIEGNPGGLCFKLSIQLMTKIVLLNSLQICIKLCWNVWKRYHCVENILMTEKIKTYNKNTLVVLLLYNILKNCTSTATATRS